MKNDQLRRIQIRIEKKQLNSTDILFKYQGFKVLLWALLYLIFAVFIASPLLIEIFLQQDLKLALGVQLALVVIAVVLLFLFIVELRNFVKANSYFLLFDFENLYIFDSSTLKVFKFKDLQDISLSFQKYAGDNRFGKKLIEYSDPKIEKKQNLITHSRFGDLQSIFPLIKSRSLLSRFDELSKKSSTLDMNSLGSEKIASFQSLIDTFNLELISFRDQQDRHWMDYAIEFKGYFRTNAIFLHFSAKTQASGNMASYGFSWTKNSLIAVPINTKDEWNLNKNPNLDFLGSSDSNEKLKDLNLQSFTWLNLFQKNGYLILVDDYYESQPRQMFENPFNQYQQAHPLWGTSMNNTQVDSSYLNKYLDLMLEIKKCMERN